MRQKRFFDKGWFMWITLILFAPLGIFLMWRNNRFSKIGRIFISGCFGMFFLMTIGSGTQEYMDRKENEVALVSEKKAIVVELDRDEKEVNNEIIKESSEQADEVLDKEKNEDKKSNQEATAERDDKEVIEEVELKKESEPVKETEPVKEEAVEVEGEKIDVSKKNQESSAEEKIEEPVILSEYVGSLESDKYHENSCRWVEKIDGDNLIQFKNIEEAVQMGYEPCGTCNPPRTVPERHKEETQKHLKVEKGNEKVLVGSTESDKYHRSGCRWAKKIKEENRISFANSEDAMNKGYKACKTCKP